MMDLLLPGLKPEMRVNTVREEEEGVISDLPRSASVSTLPAAACCLCVSV